MSTNAQARKTDVARLLPAEAAGIDPIARLFRALGDPTRLRLLEFLLTGEHTVGDCVAQVDLSQSRVSRHLAILASCGFVTLRRAGRFTYYRAVDKPMADLVRQARAFAEKNTAALLSRIRLDGGR
ncbi:MAG TPA: metalloregulator ArsR/SmtB family transcription factor [Actinophytocola sp.]|jgi:DNA-binding transcriptional ArsR family regulator|uniref:ArsR/SmtB family transcription factor n=1 Tax=Actinophytocola sp. TaxID=1872138 RepID=UPI002E0099D9|nr:metalloregulator ArsR/SmtB family transcription factor [Actinophytocola sp.]